MVLELHRRCLRILSLAEIVPIQAAQSNCSKRLPLSNHRHRRQSPAVCIDNRIVRSAANTDLQEPSAMRLLPAPPIVEMSSDSDPICYFLSMTEDNRIGVVYRRQSSPAGVNPWLADIQRSPVTSAATAWKHYFRYGMSHSSNWRAMIDVFIERDLSLLLVGYAR